jgi:PPP family 3-phenylpropionic acid transporter
VVQAREEETVPHTSVDRWTAGPWSMKSLYFCFYLAFAVYVSYVGLFLHSVHLTGTEIGFITSLVPLLGVLLQPLWGILSDRFGLRKPLLSVALLASALIAPTVALAHTFLTLLIPVVALAIVISPAIPLSDATTLEWVSRNGGSFGAVRLFGSIGFFVGSLLIGPLLGGSHIRLVFPLYGLFLGVTFLVSLRAPRQHAQTVTHRTGGIGALLRNRGIMVFLTFCALGFGSSAAYNTFFPLYLHGLGAGTAVIGLAAALASLSEFPMMVLSGRIMAWVGVKPLLLLGLGASALRWTAYGLLHDFRLALIFQVLHGLTFAASYVAGVTFMDSHVPAHLRSVGQTLFYGASFGLGAVAGTNVFGILYDHIHAHGIFLVAAATCAVAVAGIMIFVPNRTLPAPA